MDIGIKRMDRFFRNRWTTITLAIVANFSGFLGILGFFGISSTPKSLTYACVGVATFLGSVVIYAVYRIFIENRRLKLTFEQLHHINHYYRDVLWFNFSRNQKLSDAEVLAKEKEVLEKISVKIANIFDFLIGYRPHVVVSYITFENNQKFNFDIVKSEPDISHGQKVEKVPINHNNTRFFDALRKIPQCPSHFIGDDLEELKKNNKYHDPTPAWERIYKSCLVVPIRYHNNDSPEIVDEIGFLRLETVHTNRLNDKEHLQYLAAFADQMYNFLSLIRGKHVTGGITNGTGTLSAPSVLTPPPSGK